ncbi:MAG: hypothetical protein ABSG96_24940 [Terracidiphilus sp.]|jgi:hypothetical protein
MNRESFDDFADLFDRIPTCRWIPECEQILLDDGCATCHPNLFGNPEELALAAKPDTPPSE